MGASCEPYSKRNERRAEHPQLDWSDPFSFNYFFNTFCKQSNSEIYYKDKGHKHSDDIGVSSIFGILMYKCKFINYIFGTLNPFKVISSSFFLGRTRDIFGWGSYRSIENLTLPVAVNYDTVRQWMGTGEGKRL